MKIPRWLVAVVHVFASVSVLIDVWRGMPLTTVNSVLVTLWAVSITFDILLREDR